MKEPDGRMVSQATLNSIPAAMRIMAYRNPDPRCTYAFEVDSLGYCWRYAMCVDRGKPMTAELPSGGKD